MKLAKFLSNLGYGTRREVEAMIQRGAVTRRDGSVLRDGESFHHADLRINGVPCDPAPGAVLMLHKPIDYVCSTRDTGRLIYSLLPERFLARSPIMAPIGRLDRDSSGLVLLTDDGQINHRLTSPRRHVPKVYDVTLANDLTGEEGSLFASGTMMLQGETEALRPVELEVLGARAARVTLHEGRYHQVRRMFASVGNHVTALHRRSIGGLELGSLAAGEWRQLSTEEVSALLSPTTAR
jgi:16S rRNA pseudouridine516 synthase